MNEHVARALTAAKGGSRYLAAIMSGDMAPESIVEQRRTVCLACPSMVQVTVNGAAAPSNWCGEPFLEQYESDAPTCGCLLYGKVRVASEKCPQGHW